MISLYAQFLAINLEVPDIQPVASLAKPHLFPPFFWQKPFRELGNVHYARWPTTVSHSEIYNSQQLSPKLPDAVDIKRPNY